MGWEGCEGRERHWSGDSTPGCLGARMVRGKPDAILNTDYTQHRSDFLRPRVKTFTGSLWLWNKPRFIPKALLKLIFTHLLYPIQTKFSPFPKYKTVLLSSLIFPPPHSIVTLSSYQPFFKSCTKANSSRNSPQHFNWPNVINAYSRNALIHCTFRVGFK